MNANKIAQNSTKYNKIKLMWKQKSSSANVYDKSQIKPYKGSWLGPRQ